MTQCCRNCYSGAPESWTQDASVTAGVCRNKPAAMFEQKMDADTKAVSLVTRFTPVNLDKFWCREWESKWAVVRIAQKWLGF